MHKEELDTRPARRFDITYGSSQNFSDSVVILQDNENQLEYPFATIGAARLARTSLLQGTGALDSLVGSPIKTNAYNRLKGFS